MASTLNLRLSQIGQISITAHDLGRAVAFYRDRLGMRHLFTVPKMAFFECGNVRLMLSVPERPEFDHPASIIYYKVGDIKEVHNALLSEGVTFEAAPHLVARLDSHDLWMAFFRDSENNLLALMSEVARS